MSADRVPDMVGSPAGSFHSEDLKKVIRTLVLSTVVSALAAFTQWLQTESQGSDKLDLVAYIIIPILASSGDGIRRYMKDNQRVQVDADTNPK